MSVSPAVRLLSKDDAAAAARLHAACFEPGEAWSAWAFRDSLALASTLAIGIEDDDLLSGMIIVQKTPPDAEILSMAVDAGLRRRGYARTLMARLCALLGPYGMDRLLLDVAADNEAAIAFYKSCGFLVDGHRKGYYQRTSASRVDAILMSRSIAGHTGKSEA